MDESLLSEVKPYLLADADNSKGFLDLLQSWKENGEIDIERLPYCIYSFHHAELGMKVLNTKLLGCIRDLESKGSTDKEKWAGPIVDYIRGANKVKLETVPRGTVEGATVLIHQVLQDLDIRTNHSRLLRDFVRGGHTFAGLADLDAARRQPNSPPPEQYMQLHVIPSKELEDLNERLKSVWKTLVEEKRGLYIFLRLTESYIVKVAKIKIELFKELCEGTQMRARLFVYKRKYGKLEKFVAGDFFLEPKPGVWGCTHRDGTYSFQDVEFQGRGNHRELKNNDVNRRYIKINASVCFRQHGSSSVRVKQECGIFVGLKPEQQALFGTDHPELNNIRNNMMEGFEELMTDLIPVSKHPMFPSNGKSWKWEEEPEY